VAAAEHINGYVLPALVPSSAKRHQPLFDTDSQAFWNSNSRSWHGLLYPLFAIILPCRTLLSERRVHLGFVGPLKILWTPATEIGMMEA
jgi:hypothetical protein